MADRFSRFNEDRDFQVNTGVAAGGGEGAGRAPSRFQPGSAALLPFRPCTGLGSGPLFGV